MPSGGGDIAAVLFDMDGTLVDSEKIWQIGLDELAARHGGVLSVVARASMVGTTTDESMSIFYTDLGLPDVDPGEGALWLETRVLDLFAGGLMWRPGAYELLRSVRDAGIPTALVTATARRIVDVVLATMGSDNFDVVVTHDDVDNGKPHPEPYRTAAAALNVAPERCVAIEDSPTGAASALAAGCVVVVVPAEVDLSALVGVTLVPSLAVLDLDALCRIAAGAYVSSPLRTPVPE